jgi:oxygen-independent coproporphyrinogen-3 oxidase
MTIASAERASRPADASAGPVGVYIHFPWCLQKCPYCDFVSFAAKREQIEHARYADAVIAELETRADALSGRRLESVFFGGGTPSLWEPRELGRVLARVAELSGARLDDVEVTVECNPTSLDEDRARALVDVGVGRLSIGVQGLDAGRLRFLGRLHDPAGALDAVRAAVRAGVPRVSADLIYGTGGTRPVGSAEPAREEQRPEEAASEARRIVELGLTHVSAYSLTIEPGTSFGESARKGRLPLATDDTMADAFFAIEEALGAAGLRHYEVSNYAVPGFESQHNLGYWRGRDYLGLGCAAYGTLGRADGSAERYRNAIDPAEYVRAALSRAPIVVSREELDPETRLRERIMLGLRLEAGFDLDAAARELGVPAWPTARRRAADELVASGRLVEDGGKLRVPREAWIFADGVAAALF